MSRFLACAASGFTNKGCRSTMLVTRRPRCILPYTPEANQWALEKFSAGQPAGSSGPGSPERELIREHMRQLSKVLAGWRYQIVN